MLTKQFIESVAAASGLFPPVERCVFEANGLDAITELLGNLRSVEFPALILEGRDSGSIDIVEGPLDTFTQSLWVMEQAGRDDEDAEVYNQAFRLGRRLVAILIAARPECRELDGWAVSHISYLKRYGGPGARGWEFVFTFKEDINLLP
ncbi:MAG: hypothetical protein IKS71_02120 [Bacteroidales bacterium]|nr:hypothetical protein [Bacteroidales bacterium]